MDTDASLVERVTAAHDDLSPAGRRVAEFIANHPAQAAVASSAEIGSLTGTSDATVVRTVKQLGYRGMPDLKRNLSTFLAQHNPRTTLATRIDRVRDEPGEVLGLALADAAAIVEEVPRRISGTAFRAAVDLLHGAPGILAVGFGPAAALAEYAALELTRIGHRAVAATTSGFRFADAIVALRPGEVVLLFAPLLHVQEIDALLAHTRRLEAPTILVSEVLGARLAGEVTVVLPLPSSRHRLVSGIAGAAAVIDALLLGVATVAPQPALETWELLNRLRAQIVGHPVDVTMRPAIQDGAP